MRDRSHAGLVLSLLGALVLGPACTGDDDGGAVHPVCATCGDDELCVQFYDGVCGEPTTVCQAKVAECGEAACSAACDRALCKGGVDTAVYTCSAAPCGNEAAEALHCYGP